MLYLICGAVVLVCSAVLSMAGLGAAFIFVPLFYWLGIPLAEAMPTALLLNTISLGVASVSYMRGKLVDYRAAVPMIIAAVLLSPLGSYSSHYVAREMLLWLFSGFLIFAGSMMLFYRSRAQREVAAAVEDRGAVPLIVKDAGETSTVVPFGTWLGAGVGAVAGYLGGLLGVGGGNFIVPFLNWLGYKPKVAAATTAFVVVFASLAGFLGHITLGHIDRWLLAVTGGSAMIGALLGAWLMKYKLTGPQLKKIIGFLLYVIAAKIMYSLIF